MTSRQDDDVARLRAAFESHYNAILGYAIRRTRSRADAEEIAASTFAVAWRRIADVPPEPLTLTWLYRVAWKTLANHRRSLNRRSNLVDKLSGLRTIDPSEVDDTDDGRLEQALQRLKLSEQEVLRLIAWEQLSYLEAAAVLGCTPNAFAIRLHRARSALRRELEQLDVARERRPEFGGPSTKGRPADA